MAVFPKSPNTDPLPVYNIPSGTHSEAYLRTDIGSYEGSSHFEKKSAFNYETEKFQCISNLSYHMYTINTRV